MNNDLIQSQKRDFMNVHTKIVLFLFFILPLVTCPLKGQVVQKKELTPADYHLWGELRMDDVSPDGKWVSYKMHYEIDSDTVFVRNVITKKTYSFPSAKRFEFIGNDRFICHDNKILQILNLKSGDQKKIDSVFEYAYSKAMDQFILLTSNTIQNKTLLILNAQNSVIKKIDSVLHFSLSPSEKEILFTNSFNSTTKLGLLSLASPLHTKWIMEKNLNLLDNFVWQQKGRAFAFLAHPPLASQSDTLFYYILKKDILFKLNPEVLDGFPKDKIITGQDKYKISISSDLQKVFFEIKDRSPEIVPSETHVELWNANAKWIYPQEKYLGKPEQSPNLAVWFPFSKYVTAISTAQLPKVMLTGDQRYALLSNPQTYEPQFDDIAPRDFYLMDLKTGEKNILLHKLYDFERNLLPSPDGKYIAYFYKKNWWVYDLANKTHKNITREINLPFLGKTDKLGTDSPYGNPGWNTGGNELIVYDEYDIWAIKPNGTSRKLTQGRDKQIQFRIAYLLGHDFRRSNYDGWKSSTIDLNGNLILRAEGYDGKTGYFKWKDNSNIEAIVYKSSYIDQIYYASKNQSFIYQQQNFDKPPCLVFQKINKAPQTFFQSNPQQTKYYWGQSEMVEYQNSKGQKLKGILYYPANYKLGEKYPMIVQIYEKQSHEVHLYNNPTLLVQAGYNPTVFTSKGYFVLCPDIVHELGNVGETTVDCVKSATYSIINRGIVDPDKVGLIGHSFGGYESAYIITQTNMFSAAVAGAAVTDLSSFYLTVGWNTGKPDMWRFQSEQYRTGTTPFEDPLTYARNSPIASVTRIKTPLLLWSGKKDQQVDWHQSVEFYLALRQLQKKNIMLLYPEEAHSILKPENQMDLSIRVQQWFDYFLKKQQSQPWIEEGIK